MYTAETGRAGDEWFNDYGVHTNKELLLRCAVDSRESVACLHRTTAVVEVAHQLKALVCVYVLDTPLRLRLVPCVCCRYGFVLRGNPDDALSVSFPVPPPHLAHYRERQHDPRAGGQHAGRASTASAGMTPGPRASAWAGRNARGSNAFTPYRSSSVDF